MKLVIAIIGAFVLCGIMWRQEGYFIYHRPASSFPGWGVSVPAFAVWTIEVSV